MDSTQNYLLNLLLEIDTICKKHNVEYMIDYGTTLGAIRHEGFIPWDDDIDINMTEENYYKFVEACKAELDPKKRVYGDGRVDRDFPGVFGRYIDVESIRLSSNFAFWRPICGQCIDVFYMIELPGDPVKKQEKIDLYFAYDEYSNSSYRHYRYKNERQWQLYQEFRKNEAQVGKEAVLRELEERLFHKHYDDCDTYLCTSARKYGPVSVAPREFYDSVYYADFEGHKLPISGRYAEMLAYYYGDDWNIMPLEKKHHSKMSHTGISCDDYVSDYMRLLDADEIRRERQTNKHILVEEGYRTGVQLHYVYDKLGKLQRLKIEKKINKKGIDLASLLDSSKPENFAALDDIFNDYYTAQLNSSVRYWEDYFDIGEDKFYAALFNLIYGHNDFTRAAKLMKLREANQIVSDDKLAALWQLVLDARAVKAAIVYKDYEKAQSLCAAAIEKYPYCKELELLNLDIKNALEKDDTKELAKALKEKYPENDRVYKVIGDVFYREGDKEKAKKYYKFVRKNSRDGMLLLDISKKWGELVD